MNAASVMARKQPTSEPGVTRRAFVTAGAKFYMFGALCATVGSTIIAACMDSGSTKQANNLGSGNGSGSGSGYGSGYGYGYGSGYGSGSGSGYGSGYGYGYGYGYGP